jgi:hypothetical protein
MYVIAKNFVWTNLVVSQLARAAHMIPATIPARSAKIMLYTNNKIPTPNAVLGDFTEANFSGYVSASYNTTAPAEKLGEGTWGIAVITTWNVAAATPPVTNLIYGYALYLDGGTDLYGAELFDSPVAMAAVGDFLTLASPFPVSARAQWQNG